VWRDVCAGLFLAEVAVGDVAGGVGPGCSPYPASRPWNSGAVSTPAERPNHSPLILPTPVASPKSVRRRIAFTQAGHSAYKILFCIAISLKLRGNVSLNETEVGDMTIDTSPIHSALLQPLSDSDKSVARLRTASEASQFGDVGLTPSTVVSISEAARAVAQNVNDVGPTRPAPAEIASDSTTPPDGNSATDLQQLEVDILSGRRTLGISAAEFQAARSSEANSDLLLRAIQDAAQRAGFIQNREIAHNYDGADQTTFQARGVIRTAHS
jgi:hypothetical protein